MQFERWERKEVDVLVVRGKCQVLCRARREFHILQPVLHWALSSDPHLPGGDLVDSEAPTTEPNGAEASVCGDIYASGLGGASELFRLGVWWEWASVLVAVEINKCD